MKKKYALIYNIKNDWYTIMPNSVISTSKENIVLPFDSKEECKAEVLKLGLTIIDEETTI